MSNPGEFGLPAGMPALRSHPKDLLVDPEKPFLMGIEYYRPPVPPRELWDDDFARIKEAGFHIIRTFPYWNWIEPAPGRFEFDDLEELTTRIDEVFDTKGPVFVTIKSIPEIEGDAEAEEMHPELRPRGLPVAMHELHQTLNG